MDFSCAAISESGWRKLGAERRSACKCPKCRNLCATPVSPNESASLTTILQEIRELRTQMVEFNEIKTCLPKLAEEIKCIKEDLSDFKKSYDFLASSVDELRIKADAAVNKVSKLDKRVESMDSVLTEMQSKLSHFDQRSRLNNLEIKGVPIKKDENLFKIIETIGEKVGYSFPRTQINYLSRVPIYNSKEKSIVVSFLNRYIKEDFISATRACKSLKAEDIGFRDSKHRIFVNDHLNADAKNLLNKAKQLAKEKSFSYVWVKFGKIHVRKNETSGIFIINNTQDLNKFV
jgi:prefoldin subunit 5